MICHTFVLTKRSSRDSQNPHDRNGGKEDCHLLKTMSGIYQIPFDSFSNSPFTLPSHCLPPTPLFIQMKKPRLKPWEKSKAHPSSHGHLTPCFILYADRRLGHREHALVQGNDC